MPIETLCPGCQQKLRVADEFAGRSARCPVCQTNYQIPAQIRPSLDGPTWWLRTPEGKIYGTVRQNELDHWVEEGRVTPECFLSNDYGQTWISAAKEYSVLSPLEVSEIRRGSPFAMVSLQPPPDKQLLNSPSIVREQAAAEPKRARFVAPHRAGLVLAIGICSWMLCPPLAFIAWTIGSQDLREMREGNMDPGGQTITRTGYILGMIQAYLSMLLISIGFLAWILGV